MIVHLNMSKMAPFLTKDTHYRNQFETGTSGGSLNRSLRVNWEDRLFNQLYHRASNHDRVKSVARGVVGCVGRVFSQMCLPGICIVGVPSRAGDVA